MRSRRTLAPGERVDDGVEICRDVDSVHEVVVAHVDDDGQLVRAQDTDGAEGA